VPPELAGLAADISASGLPRISGRVIAVRGELILARLPHAALGDFCTVARPDGSRLASQVVAFEGDRISLAPLESPEGVCPGARVESSVDLAKIRVWPGMRGMIVDALGQPLGGARGFPACSFLSSIKARPPAPLTRSPISEVMETGISSIDGLCPIGYGQRLGLFAPSALGKSTLLGMLARNARVDVSVIALVGERGREVREFVEESLGEAGRRDSVLVVATSEETAARRRLAPLTATAIAEYFREQGQRVLLLVDSLTRTARAIRDTTLSAGEIPVRQGYTPSVYAELPRLLERAGNSSRGSITAIYSILTSPDGEYDALGEEIKSLLDGHIVLDTRVMGMGIRRAIDPLQSSSRLLSKLHKPEYLSDIRNLLRLIARLKHDKDLLLFGANPDEELKRAIELEPELFSLLNQAPCEVRSLVKTISHFRDISRRFCPSGSPD